MEMYDWKKVFLRWGKRIVNISIFFASIVVLALFLRVFAVASFHVSTSSMEPTIMPGDYILVNQLVLGARYFKEVKGSDDGESVVPKRVPGFRKVRRNDILVFNLPHLETQDMDVSVHYIKRCVAIPGDTFFIRNGYFRVKGFSDNLGNVDVQKRFSKLERTSLGWGALAYPYDSLRGWTIWDLGPFYIPAKGDTINISAQNYSLYRDAIMYETRKDVWYKSDTIWLGAKPIDRYVFQHDYFFMAGDNVFDSGDSRYWGLLPDDHIIGKAVMIWKSKDIRTGKYYWKRFFNSLQ